MNKNSFSSAQLDVQKRTHMRVIDEAIMNLRHLLLRL